MATNIDRDVITLYDTTLRDGTQAEDISFSVEDKVRVARVLDELGVHYVEGGWPGSNPRDAEFFGRMKKEKLSFAILAAFGSTRRRGVKASDDLNVKALLKASTGAVTVFGKSWKLHVKRALGASLAENLDMIFDTVSYLKKKTGAVFYDAEHFFDGYHDDPEYALKTLDAAATAGADCLVLCDTNGGTLPQDVSVAVMEVERLMDTPLGIHAHNDSGVAVANSLMAVTFGATHVQGTMNGFGERCGNADLTAIIPALSIKMGLKALGPEKLKRLSAASKLIYEIANLPHPKHQPYVGDSAFAHKGGIHVSAVMKDSGTYEHMAPEAVGNRRRVLVSDLSGRSNILYKAREFGVDLDSSDPAAGALLKELKTLEHQGYQYEGAEASFELLLDRAMKKKRRGYFKLIGFRVTEEKLDGGSTTEATIKIEVDGRVEHTAAEGNGPVNALDRALRKALERFYPSLREVALKDFKVRVLEGCAGTAARVRVLVESGDGKDEWGTVGVSENVVEASWQALVDSLEYKLFKDSKRRRK
jgi:2-isopropylmalate synthase